MINPPFFRISKNTTPDELKHKYRELCKRFHPDKNGGDHQIMARINVEYKLALQTLVKQAGPNKNGIRYEGMMFEIERQFVLLCQQMKKPLIGQLPKKYQILVEQIINFLEKG